MRVVAAAALYFLIVFGAGFLLGPVRVFLLEPRFGEAVATLFEAPFILVVIVVAARRLAEALGLKTIGSLAGMGFGALALQQLADFVVGSFLRGLTPAQQLAHLATPAGLIYAALLIAFAVMPIFAGWSRLRRPERH